jgi:hypothetical protein
VRTSDLTMHFLFQVLGLGPTFKIHITLENMSVSNPVKDLAITFHCDDKFYIIDRPFIQVSISFVC